MEEERARQEAAAKKAAEDASKPEKGGEAQSSSQDATMTERASAGTSEADNKSNDFMVSVISFVLSFLFLLYFVNKELQGGCSITNKICPPCSSLYP